MTPGTRVRVTSGIFKGQTYIVGNMIGLQSPTLRNAVKELCLNRDVLEVTGEEGVSAEQELYQALHHVARYYEWFEDPPPFMVTVNEVLVKYAPREEKSE